MPAICEYESIWLYFDSEFAHFNRNKIYLEKNRTYLIYYGARACVRLCILPFELDWKRMPIHTRNIFYIQLVEKVLVQANFRIKIDFTIELWDVAQKIPIQVLW